MSQLAEQPVDASSVTPPAAAGMPLPPRYPFFAEFARTFNSGQSRSVMLTGAVADLLYSQRPGGPQSGEYVPLVKFLCDRCAIPGVMVLVYELNGPIRTLAGADTDKLKSAWVAWQAGVESEQFGLAALADNKRRNQQAALEAEFDRSVREAIGQPTVALEFLRQLCIMSRAVSPAGRRYLDDSLLVIVEAADMLVPAGKGDIADLNPADRHRVGILADWFTEPGFMNGLDQVLMIADSRAGVHPRITGIPSVLSLSVPAPDVAAREHYIAWYMAGQSGGSVGTSSGAASSGASPSTVETLVAPRPLPKLWSTPQVLATATAGLSIHALRQLLLGSAHSGNVLTMADVVGKVEIYIASQLGEDVIEFKRPSHRLDDCVGFTDLKAFLLQELVPRFRATGPEALPGAAVAGPIGGGKTFIFEALASELDLPVLVLKNIRSQWYGQTDVIFEKLRGVLESLGKCLIFVDEADTQFGSVGADAHETERRLTGKIQQMMSDPRLRGRVIWLLMTARIHLLSPDIRRPGRVGDLIIPVLDPQGADRDAFLAWTLRNLTNPAMSPEQVATLAGLTADYSAAAYASLRSNLKARQQFGGKPLTLESIEAIIRDTLQPNIGLTRRYQTLQALLNTTRRSLLPDPNTTDAQRELWDKELRVLELRGIR